MLGNDFSDIWNGLLNLFGINKACEVFNRLLKELRII